MTVFCIFEPCVSGEVLYFLTFDPLCFSLLGIPVLPVIELDFLFLLFCVFAFFGSFACSIF